MDKPNEQQNQNQNQNLNQSQSQNQNQEKPYQDNSNVYNKNQENKKNNNLKNNSSNEIELLKKEINNLEAQHNNDEQKINDMSKYFQSEINLLKNQIKALTKEINELKNIKNKKDLNNINNINNDNNNNESDEDMEDPNRYSMQCLSSRLNIEILQGTEKADINVMIKNTSNEKFPQNTFLICDNKNSLLLCENVKLNQLEPKQQQNVLILFKNLKYVSKGKYRCIVKLQVNNKTYNSLFEITVDVLENVQNPLQQQPNFIYPQGIMPGQNLGNFNQGQNMNIGVGGRDIEQLVINFKYQFELFNNDNITDEMIKEKLERYGYDFNKTFESLYE